MAGSDNGSTYGAGQGHALRAQRTTTARPGQGRSSRVRPYTITRGRTRFTRVLLVETLVSALNRPTDPADRALPELAAICELCRGQMRSVAEISALLRIPLGVVKVLVSDLADQGRIRVHGTDSAGAPGGAGEAHGTSKRDLLEKVLGGLRKL
ncbi:DUF742 domain-containing protein [Kitasatospora sp. NBC_00240]|uniref:DUF742 domain-containing protein n=1 Tax=Kitasatospora sp. NBC_00240 TaxID=2903567 RepID=UPI002252A29D|nr:DUF742 domain-containing protein [Kitasatospora sp. NBC_00240]MCX5209010.1 DUF742 domain-containing protein [Kitasatospora sp. NBC_00240]